MLSDRCWDSLCSCDKCSSPFLFNVTVFEKWGHFAQGGRHFAQYYHHSKVSSVLGFWLGLLAVWAFYFTNPMLEGTASHLSRAVIRHKTMCSQIPTWNNNINMHLFLLFFVKLLCTLSRKKIVRKNHIKRLGCVVEPYNASWLHILQFWEKWVKVVTFMCARVAPPLT
jgi:hypothetical protein